MHKIDRVKTFLAIGLGLVAIGILDKCIFHIPYLAAFAFGLSFGFVLLSMFASDNKNEKVELD